MDVILLLYITTEYLRIEESKQSVCYVIDRSYD